MSSMSASRPATSGSSGSAPCTPRASRIASSERSRARQVGAAVARVALGEHQVEDVQHGSQPLAPLFGGRERERLVGRLDRRLRPADALGHRRLGDEERGRDLAGREPADRAQRERDRRRRA